MYVDATDNCNELAFTLGPSTTQELTLSGVKAAATRSWNIKVCYLYFYGANKILYWITQSDLSYGQLYQSFVFR